MDRGPIRTGLKQEGDRIVIWKSIWKNGKEFMGEFRMGYSNIWDAYAALSLVRGPFPDGGFHSGHIQEERSRQGTL